MSATLYGVASLGYGVADEAAKGYYIEDMTLDVDSDEVWMQNHIGEDLSLVLYNEKATLTGSGVIKTANDPFHTLGGILSVANTGLFGHVKMGGGTAFTKFYVNSMQLRDENKEFQKGNFTAVSRFGITDASGTGQS